MFSGIPKIIANQFDPQFIEIGQEIYQKGAYHNFDFVRNSFCAQFSDNRGSYCTYIKKKGDKDNFTFACDCNTFMRHRECPHIPALFFIIYSRREKPATIYDNISRDYYSSLWEILAKESFELYGNTKISLQSHIDLETKKIEILCKNEEDQLVFVFELPQTYWGKIWDKYRYLIFDSNEEQVQQLISAIKKIAVNHREILKPEKTELEERMNLAGFKSWQQKFEESLFFNLSKIWFLTIAEDSLQVDYHPESQSLEISSNTHNFHFMVQKNQLATILNTLTAKPAFKKLIQFSDDKIFLNYSLKITKSFDLKITPILIMPGGEKPLHLTKKNNLTVGVFGKYLYLESKGFFLFERSIPYFDSSIFHFSEATIPNEKIPMLQSEYRKTISDNKFYYVSPSLLSENYINKVDSAKVIVSQIKDDWCYLDVKYQNFNESISFYDIYCSIQKGKRYLIGEKFWLDLDLPEFAWIHELTSDQIEITAARNVRLKLNKLNFFKMHSLLPIKSKIISRGDGKIELDKLLNFEPRNKIPSLKKRKYVLRDYQATGYGWLWFLYENNLSGLLCDDMGLGKTYESLALLDAVTEVKEKAKFLVVCPTSVIPHWRDKLSRFKKKVHLHVYHGAERELNQLAKEKYTVILTSYGIMRNDLPVLEKIPFEVMVFDEIQSAKNKASLTNAALNQLNGRVKIGLTGTPIENDLFELKALFDVILPNYLGSDTVFKKRYIEPIEKEDKAQLERLHRMITPFMLRRTKGQVLEELPPKTEEVRTCELSPDQVKLYKDVISSRAISIIEQLSHPDEQIPYIHIFAILNYLKQICNHPSQLEKSLDYQKYQSGKWDLFCELLEESLNSGFKVVVFSQYLNMLALIEAYLNDLGVEFATIKGSTSNRGEMIEKFNQDPNCMVFTGSLKAAGLGIDLIGGSVVIHYDRWWNAAREDQATDRVHRIGQTRGVQVFKLITEGTLEEKIDSLINKKKNLMENLVREDDAKVIKKFDREELIGLLTFKQGE